MNTVYLDWAATALPDAALQREALSRSLETYGNPSSAHWLGKSARSLLETSRANLMRALGLDRGSLVFTGSGTEADQIPLFSLIRRALRARQTARPIHIVASAIEHAAIDSQLRHFEKMGIEVSWVPPDARGLVDPQRIADRVRSETALVAVMAVNNETGAIQPTIEIGRAIRKAAATAHARGLWFHVDGVQALGKIPIRELADVADSIALSAHKIQGPKGIGGLWLARSLEPLAQGGGQEQGIRSGTENVFGAVAFAMAVENACQNFEARAEQARALERILIDGISRIAGALSVPHREPAHPDFVPQIVSVAFPGVGGETMVRALSDRGIAVSTGSACSSAKAHQGRRVLNAMGIPENIALCAVRISTGPSSTARDIDLFLEHCEDLYRVLKT